ncbi:hypothetical protein QE152_g35773 [Popillia japonica]|uniref:Uncharacterized protein n=1 Tax=Popillia japonica TaxID=7064 RepID=A0AAW1IER1_POPJA
MAESSGKLPSGSKHYGRRKENGNITTSDRKRNLEMSLKIRPAKPGIFLPTNQLTEKHLANNFLLSLSIRLNKQLVQNFNEKIWAPYTNPSPSHKVWCYNSVSNKAESRIETQRVPVIRCFGFCLIRLKISKQL